MQIRIGAHVDSGDPLTAATVAGGLLILVAVVVAEVLPPWVSARRAAVRH